MSHADCTKAVLGYVREHFMMTEPEMANARQNLVDLAASENLELTKIYVERIESVPQTFRAMMIEVERECIDRIVVPGLHHLAVIGNPETIKTDLGARGVEVLVARHAD